MTYWHTCHIAMLTNIRNFIKILYARRGGAIKASFAGISYAIKLAVFGDSVSDKNQFILLGNQKTYEINIQI